MGGRALAAQERLRKLQQLQRAARPAQHGSRLSASASHHGARSHSAAAAAPPSDSAEALSLEDILRRAAALLAGPGSWDPAGGSTTPADQLGARAAAQPSAAPGSGWPGDPAPEDECVDALVARARRLLEQGAPAAGAASTPAGGGAGGAGAWQPWAWERPADDGDAAGASADGDPAAGDDLLAAYLARAQAQAALDGAWGQPEAWQSGAGAGSDAAHGGRAGQPTPPGAGLASHGPGCAAPGARASNAGDAAAAAGLSGMQARPSMHREAACALMLPWVSLACYLALTLPMLEAARAGVRCRLVAALHFECVSTGAARVSGPHRWLRTRRRRRRGRSRSRCWLRTLLAGPRLPCRSRAPPPPRRGCPAAARRARAAWQSASLCTGARSGRRPALLQRLQQRRATPVPQRRAAMRGRPSRTSRAARPPWAPAAACPGRPRAQTRRPARALPAAMPRPTRGRRRPAAPPAAGAPCRRARSAVCPCCLLAPALRAPRLGRLRGTHPCQSDTSVRCALSHGRKWPPARRAGARR